MISRTARGPARYCRANWFVMHVGFYDEITQGHESEPWGVLDAMEQSLFSSVKATNRNAAAMPRPTHCMHCSLVRLIGLAKSLVGLQSASTIARKRPLPTAPPAIAGCPALLHRHPLVSKPRQRRPAVALQQHAPEAPATTDPQCALTRRPADVADLEAALPRCRRPTLLACPSRLRAAGRSLSRRLLLLAGCGGHPGQDGCRVVAAGGHQVPEEDTAVVATAAEEAALGAGPLDAVDGAGVAFEFEQGLAGLPHIQDADDGGVLGEGGEKVCIVW